MPRQQLCHELARAMSRIRTPRRQLALLYTPSTLRTLRQCRASQRILLLLLACFASPVFLYFRLYYLNKNNMGTRLPAEGVHAAAFSLASSATRRLAPFPSAPSFPCLCLHALSSALYSGVAACGDNNMHEAALMLMRACPALPHFNCEWLIREFLEI